MEVTRGHPGHGMAAMAFAKCWAAERGFQSMALPYLGKTHGLYTIKIPKIIRVICALKKGNTHFPWYFPSKTMVFSIKNHGIFPSKTMVFSIKNHGKHIQKPMACRGFLQWNCTAKPGQQDH
jgi:hypothetical protein